MCGYMASHLWWFHMTTLDFHLGAGSAILQFLCLEMQWTLSRHTFREVWPSHQVPDCFLKIACGTQKEQNREFARREDPSCKTNDLFLRCHNCQVSRPNRHLPRMALQISSLLQARSRERNLCYGNPQRLQGRCHFVLQQYPAEALHNFVLAKQEHTIHYLYYYPTSALTYRVLKAKVLASAWDVEAPACFCNTIMIVHMAE